TFTANQLPAGMEPGLEEQAFFDPTGLTCPNSAHIAQVEVDPATGEVEIQRYIAVDDVGNVINPMIVEGQLLGGIVHGVGQALLECARYDSNGQLLSGSLMDYAMPRSNLMPMIEMGRTVSPAPSNPLGVKGAGEMGTIASTPAICNAVMDALQIDHLDMPLTAERIWQALQ
ncbi:MAG: molybdopterin-dependent oxidoreductase, partial [Chloroflexi bacterium]|nr:molybdopterin-dependent oxidoreductase [Chloroflexota bacterium]